MRLYLKEPTINEKEEWLKYVYEYKLDDKNSSPLGYDENIEYEDWLSSIYMQKNDEIQSRLYFFMNEEKIIGHVSIKNSINNNYLEYYLGNIGGGIHPLERGKGYASLMLGLSLEKCYELGLKNIFVTCQTDNIASRKVIEKNNGILEGLTYEPSTNKKVRIYRMNFQ